MTLRLGVLFSLRPNMEAFMLKVKIVIAVGLAIAALVASEWYTSLVKAGMIADRVDPTMIIPITVLALIICFVITGAIALVLGRLSFALIDRLARPPQAT